MTDNLNHFFCLLKPSRPNMHGNLTPEEGVLFGQHCDYLAKKFEDGVVLQAGTSFEKGEDGFAIVIIAAKNKDAAIAIMQADPVVANGLLKANVTEYKIFLDRGMV